MKLQVFLLTFLFVLFLPVLSFYASTINVKEVKGVVEGSFTIYCIEDTMTIDYLPNSQLWYDEEVLEVGYDTTIPVTKFGWFKFNLSEKSDLGQLNVTSAYLYLYYDSTAYGSGQASFRLKSIDYTNETWDDETITWNNQPSRCSWYENSGVDVSSSKMWYGWSLNVTSVQTAYDNNRTKTYVLSTASSYWMGEWRSLEYTGYKPKLYVEYQQKEEQTGTETPPIISNPEYHILTYYPKADAELNSASPNTNWGTEETGQIKHSIYDGVTIDHIFKFDMSFPDLLDGNENTWLNLSEIPFDAVYIHFSHECQFVPEEPPPCRGYTMVNGISRIGEDWNETTITWNNKPQYRTLNLGQTFVDKAGWYFIDISIDESFIRNSILNYSTTYSLVHRYNQTISHHAYSDWRFREYSLQKLNSYALQPHIEMKVAINSFEEEFPETLTFSNAHLFLAANWHVTPFIAGHMLSAMIYGVTVVPIGYVLKDSDYAKWIITIFSVGLTTLFVIFGWMHLGIYVFLLVFSLVTVLPDLLKEIKE